ncbi:hypothetical protein DESPIGER_1522 [Desulfovibrio piger]|uniref:Uncharacterized protein n=1 Tax=Desulfovibrio piger TaxID=901 RepID=A0A1K1LF89_9BACT|nr:hypothetical protein DESPIGER_1522 [Desulfovibrio piger]
MFECIDGLCHGGQTSRMDAERQAIRPCDFLPDIPGCCRNHDRLFLCLPDNAAMLSPCFSSEEPS